MNSTFSPALSVWRKAGLAFAVAVLALVALFWNTGASMVGVWARSDTFAHGFFVLPITLWLVWRRRQTLATVTPTPSGAGIALLAVVGFLWLLGDLAAVNALSQLALVALLVLLVPAMLGLGVARAIAFPLAFLFFAVPFGEFALPQLMQWTADFTVLAVRASGIPVYQEGLQFIIPTGSWSVIQACSGIRYIIASLTVGTLFAYLSYQSIKRRALFMLVSLLVPVVANWMRAYMIVMLGHLSGNKLATGVDHIIYGWVFFGLVMMLMFWIGARWSEPEPEVPLAAAPSVRALGASSVQGAGRWILVSLAIVLVLALPQLLRWKIQRTQDSLPAPQLQVPIVLAPGWTALPLTTTPWQPAFHNPSAEITTAYSSGANTVKMFVAYYRNQNANRKLVSSDNVLVTNPDPVWAQVASGKLTVPVAGGASLKVRTGELRSASLLGGSDADRLVVWQYYWVNGTLTSSDMLAKAFTALYSLLGQGDDSAVVIVYAPKGDAGQGAQAIEAFVQAHAGAINQWLRSVKP